MCFSLYILLFGGNQAARSIGYERYLQRMQIRRIYLFFVLAFCMLYLHACFAYEPHAAQKMCNSDAVFQKILSKLSTKLLLAM